MNETPTGSGGPASILTRSDKQPRVWLVTGYRAGERSQILALAEALDWPYELKEFSYRAGGFAGNLFRRSDLGGIHIAKSSPLSPPWPDLVISAGMRNEPVCRWIRIQSGGRTRIVHIGRPWARPEHFDLVITTPQYRLPIRDNILHNTLTLHRVTAQRLASEELRWAPRFAHLPRPWITVVVGGDSGPYTFGANCAHRLARRASRMAAERDGSLLISTSARTSRAAIQALQDGIQVPYELYRWRKDDKENPYFGMLACGEVLIVTADSISMLSEACATGKPVYMQELGGAGYPMRVREDVPMENDFSLRAWFYSLVMRFGPQRLSRDIRLVHRQLLSQGRATWLGESFPAERPALPPADLQRAVRRVRQLFLA